MASDSKTVKALLPARAAGRLSSTWHECQVLWADSSACGMWLGLATLPANVSPPAKEEYLVGSPRSLLSIALAPGREDAVAVLQYRYESYDRRVDAVEAAHRPGMGAGIRRIVARGRETWSSTPCPTR